MILIRISSLTDSIPPTSLNVRLGRSISTDGARRGLRPRRPHPALDDLARFRVEFPRRLFLLRADPHPLGKLAIGDARVGVHSAMVLPNGLFHFAGSGQQSGIKHKRQRRSRRVLGECFQNHDGQVVLALLHERIGKADLEMNVIGGERERFPKLGLRKLGPPLREQTLSEVPPQRNILGRQAHSLSQSLQSFIGLNANSWGGGNLMQIGSEILA